MMAEVNANYGFIMIYGRVSNGGIISCTKFGNMLKEQTLKTPKQDLLINTSYNVPYVFVANDAFAMRENVLNLIVK